MIARFADLGGDGTVSPQEVVRQIGADVRGILAVGNPADPQPTRVELIRYAGAPFGDLNGDTAVDVSDVAALLQSFAGGGAGSLPEGDLNNDTSIDVQNLLLLLDGLGGWVPFTHDDAILALTGAAVMDFPVAPPDGPEMIASCNSGGLVSTLTANLTLCGAAARCLALPDRRASACCLSLLGPADILRELLTRTCVRRALVGLGIVTAITFVNPANPAIPWDEECDARCNADLVEELLLCAEEWQIRKANCGGDRGDPECLRRAWVE